MAAIVTELLERVGLPARLVALGIEQADLDAVARMSQAHPGLAAGHRAGPVDRGRGRPRLLADAR